MRKEDLIKRNKKTGLAINEVRKNLAYIAKHVTKYQTKTSFESELANTCNRAIKLIDDVNALDPIIFDHKEIFNKYKSLFDTLPLEDRPTEDEIKIIEKALGDKVFDYNAYDFLKDIVNNYQLEKNPKLRLLTFLIKKDFLKIFLSNEIEVFFNEFSLLNEDFASTYKKISTLCKGSDQYIEALRTIKYATLIKFLSYYFTSKENQKRRG